MPGIIVADASPGKRRRKIRPQIDAEERREERAFGNWDWYLVLSRSRYQIPRTKYQLPALCTANNQIRAVPRKDFVKKLNLRSSSANWFVFLCVSRDCHLDRRGRIPRKRDSFAEWRDPENVPGAMPTQGILRKDRPPTPRLLDCAASERPGTRLGLELSPIAELQRKRLRAQAH